MSSGTQRTSKYDAQYEVDGHENIHIEHERVLQQFNEAAQFVKLQR